jgi:predicted RNA binding protein YcfA (HicA-like mRNA interferase family)
MVKLPSLSSRQIVQALRRAGFVEAPDRGKGSHRAFYRVDPSGRPRLVIVPQGKDIPRGTLRAIFEQAGLAREEFVRLL